MLDNLSQREVFHLFFLSHFVARAKPGTYALKGGVNLRFFFKSIRYSEDMDLDIREIEVFKLKELVLGVLASRSLLAGLGSYGILRIDPPDMSVAKQTETTQRFKIHLHTASGEDLFTKIEFSRRNLDAPVVTRTIDAAILQHYKMAPLIVAHYPAHIAMSQKIRALAGRTQTQARDIFDIYMLIPQLEKNVPPGISVPRAIIEKALERTMDVSFARFRDTVSNYLNEDGRRSFGARDVWDDIQLVVHRYLTEHDRNGSKG